MWDRLFDGSIAALNTLTLLLCNLSEACTARDLLCTFGIMVFVPTQRRCKTFRKRQGNTSHSAGKSIEIEFVVARQTNGGGPLWRVRENSPK
jgi:hypothetical protein